MITEKRSWSKYDKDFLTANWGRMTPGEIARGLHRTELAVKNRAFMMGLRKPEEVNKGNKMPPMCLPTTNNNRKFAERVHAKKIVDPVAGKVAIRVDHRTVIYVKPGTSAKDIERMKKQYQRKE